jgi:hypothetical protein
MCAINNNFVKSLYKTLFFFPGINLRRELSGRGVYIPWRVPNNLCSLSKGCHYNTILNAESGKGKAGVPKAIGRLK